MDRYGEVGRGPNGYNGGYYGRPTQGFSNEADGFEDASPYESQNARPYQSGGGYQNGGRYPNGGGYQNQENYGMNQAYEMDSGRGNGYQNEYDSGYGYDNGHDASPPKKMQPVYDEVLIPNAPESPMAVPVDTHPAHQASGPWYNPRYWRKRVWVGVGALVVIIIIVAVAVGVTESHSSKNTSYPDYTPLNYTIQDTFSGASFFDNFDYFTGYDPTQGFVHYVPEGQAKELNLTYATADSAVVKVDTSVGPEDNPNASTGRFSVRLTSKNSYNSGLFIFNVKHTPYGCGTWPALWLTDPSNWPNNGEIDVMESTNLGNMGNQMTLHTTSGCDMNVVRKESFTQDSTDCNHSDNNNTGCGVTGSPSTFGPQFNQNQGGVLAVEWRNAGIRIWQFMTGSIPSDITNKSPSPNTWGMASADFPSTDCDISSHFQNQSIIIDIDLCGSLVYGDWTKSGCSSNCTDLVANQPESFKTAFWEFGAFEVYQPTSS